MKRLVIGEIGKLKSDRILKYIVKKMADKKKEIIECINITSSNIKPIFKAKLG